MQNRQDTFRRIEAAQKLFLEKSTNREKFEAVRELMKGINPRIDNILAISSKMLSDIERLGKGEVIEVSAEHLPEGTEEEKKRKKRILLFLRYWKQLKGEVERVRAEFDSKSQTKSQGEQIEGMGKIIAYAKGPFGLITLAAVVIVAGSLLMKTKSTSPLPPSSPLSTQSPPSPQPTTPPTATIKVTIKGIIFQGKKIALSELITGQGPECMTGKTQAPHYHAKDHIAAKAIDGSSVQDPGECGFGKVDEVDTVEFLPQ